MWQLFDGLEECIRLCGAKALFVGERAENGDCRADAGTARHLQVLRSVADVDSFLRIETHAAQGEFQGSGMGLALCGVAAADAR